MPRISKRKQETVLVLDSDSSVYAIGFVTETKEHFLLDSDGKIVWQGTKKLELNKWQKEHDPDKELVHDFTLHIAPVSHALSSAKKYINNTLDFTGCSRVIVLLTKGGDCFRHHLATIQRYKGNRINMQKPAHYEAIREYYMEHHGAKMYDKWEADDAACMALHRGSGVEGISYILGTIDKDLAQQQGRHVNPSKKDEGVYTITEVEGWYNFYHQMLMGDKADHIKGLSGKKGHPGMGKMTAAKRLLPAGNNISYMCLIVYDEYRQRYGAEEFNYVPWWCDEDMNPDGEFADRPRVLKGTALSMFRENADLLYMLRTPTDQYLPHCKTLLDLWDKYPEGTAYHFLPDEEEDDEES